MALHAMVYLHKAITMATITEDYRLITRGYSNSNPPLGVHFV